jgi:hypothetical protein
LRETVRRLFGSRFDDAFGVDGRPPVSAAGGE